jgi:hypothetical protein
MPKRIVKDLVILYRDGKQVVPEVGVEFDFTAEELASVNKSNPKALAKVGEDTEVIPALLDTASTVAEKPKAK